MEIKTGISFVLLLLLHPFTYPVTLMLLTSPPHRPKDLWTTATMFFLLDLFSPMPIGIYTVTFTLLFLTHEIIMLLSKSSQIGIGQKLILLLFFAGLENTIITILTNISLGYYITNNLQPNLSISRILITLFILAVQYVYERYRDNPHPIRPQTF